MYVGSSVNQPPARAVSETVGVRKYGSTNSMPAPRRRDEYFASAPNRRASPRKFR